MMSHTGEDGDWPEPSAGSADGGEPRKEAEVPKANTLIPNDETVSVEPDGSTGGKDAPFAWIAKMLRPHMYALADRIVGQVQEAIPQYADAVGEPRQEILASAARAAAEHFIARAEGSQKHSARVIELFQQLGTSQARNGYGRESLDIMLRSASRWSWRFLTDLAIAEGLSTEQLSDLTEAVFDYLDYIQGCLIEGYEEEQQVGALDGSGARAELMEVFLADPQPKVVIAEDVGIDEKIVTRLAEKAEWPLHEEVVAMAVSYHHQPPAIQRSKELLIKVAPGRTFVVCPAESASEWAADIGRSGVGLRVAVSWPVSPTQAGSALRWCQRALDLVQLGLIEPTPIVDCEEHITLLWLHAEPSVRQHLCQILLAPLLEESPNSRAILSETLLAWVETRDSAPAIAARLDVHPQTVRYRWRRLHELFGEQLRDPELLVQMVLVLKSTVPLWQAGDPSDFELYEARAEAELARAETES